MVKSYTINVDIVDNLAQNGYSGTVYNQGDINSAILNINITQDEKPYDLTGSTVSVVFNKPDGTVVYQDSTNGLTITNAVNGNISVNLNTQTLTAVGKVTGAIKIINGAITVETGTFSFTVKKSMASDAAIASQNNIIPLQGLIKFKSFTATSGQTVFDLSDIGNYTPGQNRLNVTVGGVLQPPTSYTETNATTFALSEPLAAGTVVNVEWTQGGNMYIAGHNTTHQSGGGDALDVTKLVNYTEQIATPISNINASLADIALDIKNFGYIGDGVNDDAVSIQNAINYATTLIQQKSTAVDVFAGQVTIQLPPKKIYVKSKIIVNNAVIIQGHGTATSIVLNNNLDYIFDVTSHDPACVTKNEESPMEGGALRNLRISGNKRQFTLTSAIRLYSVDHFMIDTLYFYAVKGKCIELHTARECNFNNLFTRFCGTTTQGVIEVVQEDNGSDTSNLNMGMNWNIVFPYGPALKIVNGTYNSPTFTNINGFLIHGIFSTIESSLAGYFGTDEYNNKGSNQIEITNGEVRITGGHFVYCPNLNSYIKLTNSVCNIAQSHLNSHYTTNETHGSGDYFFYVSSASTLYIGSGVYCTCAFQNADLFYMDSNSFVYGALADISSAQYLNANVTKKVVASEIDLLSDKTSPVTIKPRATQSAVVNSYGRMMFDIRTASDLNTSIMQLGVDSGITIPVAVLYGNTFINNLFIGNISSLPTAGSSHENKMIIVPGNGTSTADILYVCLKSATGTYSWKQIVSG